VAVTPAAESDPVAAAGSPWDDRLRLDASGLLPAVVQDASTGRVLMLAWMDREALRRTVDTRRATYWSRSRQAYWVKGETSGNTQRVRQVRLDCDGDTLLLVVDQTGPACHTGADTCFDDAPLLDDAGSDG
jgi:phosphoribosyl-AMP cyclohydrolase